MEDLVNEPQCGAAGNLISCKIPLVLVGKSQDLAYAGVMKPNTVWRWLPLMILTSVWSAASDPPDVAWSTRSYGLALPAVESGFISTDGREIKAPTVPKENAPEAEVKKFLEESTAALTAYFHAPKTLEELGPTEFPAGTVFAYDADSACLTVRTQGQNHLWLKDLCSFRGPPVDLPLRHHLQIVEADAPLIRKAMQDSLTRSDHRPLLAALEQEIGLGHGARCSEAVVVTKSMGGDSVEIGKECEYASGFRWEVGKILSETERRNVGLSFDAASTGNRRGEARNLFVTIRHHFGPPVSRLVPLDMGKEERWQLPLTDFQCLDFNCSIKQKPGVTRLIGVWSAQKFGLPEAGAKLQAAFLTLDVEQGPRGNQLAAWLGKYGEALPTNPPPAPKSNGWLFTAYFQMPGSYVYAPRNPKSQPTGSANDSDTLGPAPTALECLTDFVPTFPIGSDATFLPGSSLVLVRTSRDCLGKLDEVLRLFEESGTQTDRIDQLSCALEIFQADGEVLRQLMAKHPANDPAGLHQALETAVQDHRALLVETAQMATEIGGSCKLEAALEQTVLSVGKPTKKSESDSFEDPQTKAANSAGHIGGTQRRAGLAWELGAGFVTDRKTLEMRYAVEYHYAPPLLQPAPVKPDGGQQPAAIPSTDFHSVRLKSEICLTLGQDQLIGMWKPTGVPAFDGKDILQVAFLRVQPSVVETSP